MLVKPDMKGCFPPECNIVKPEMYSQFTLQENSSVTRMGMYIPVARGQGISVLRPDVLESVYYRMLKYGGKSTKFTPKSDLLNNYASDFVTNEERMYGKIGYAQENMDPAVVKAYSWIFKNDWEEEKKKLEKLSRELTDVDVINMLTKMPPLGEGVKKKQAIEEIRVVLVARGLSGVEAKSMATKYYEKFKEHLSTETAAISSATQSLDAKTTAIKTNSDFISNLSAMDDELGSSPTTATGRQVRDAKLKRLNEEQKTLLSKWSDEYNKIVERLKDPPHKKRLTEMVANPPGIDDYIIGLRQEAQKRYDALRGGAIGVSGTLNLSPVCGFPILFADPDGDDAIGYLVGKVDTIEWGESTIATTEYTVENPRPLYKVDYNSPTRNGKFMFNNVGQNHFSWGKNFDYSTMVYSKFLKSRAFIPIVLANSGFESLKAKNFLKNIETGLTTTAVPENIPNRIYFDDALADLGLFMADNDFSHLWDEMRDVDAPNDEEPKDIGAMVGVIRPEWDRLKDVYKYKSREQFYCVADVLSKIAEADASNLQDRLELLDSRNGRLGYLFMHFDPKKTVPVKTKNFYKKFGEFATDKLAPNDMEEVQKLTKYEIPSSPRRGGNPGISFTDLLLAYLSTFEVPITAKDVHGSGSIPSSNESDKLKPRKDLDAVTKWHKSRYRTASRALIVDIISDMQLDIEKNRAAYVTNGGVIDYSFLDKEIKKAYSVNEAYKKTEELQEYGRNYKNKSTDVTLKQPELDYIKDTLALGLLPKSKAALNQYDMCNVLTPDAGRSIKGNGKNLKLADMATTEIPRPMSDADCIEFRRVIVYNMIEEMKRDVR